jgi:archaemetzincin
MKIASILYFLLVLVVLLTSCLHDKTKELSPYHPDPAIDQLASLDLKLGEPLPGDWLDVHEEAGQPFEQYIKSKPVTPSGKRFKIYLQPIGQFSEMEEKLVAYTADYLQLFFTLETIVLPVLSDEIVPATARRKTDTGDQLQTTFIMNYLQRVIPDDGIVILAITPVDLYAGNFNYVFGQARTLNRVAVSSFKRFTDAPLDSTNYSVCLGRLIKTSSHEIGHMFTCLHCIHAVCLMNGSNSLWESDARPNRLCSDCLRKLEWNLHFRVKPRLEGMIDFFMKHKLKDEYQRAIKDLSTIGD